MSFPEAKFKINVKEGTVELEGNEGFVDKHLDKFEEIFKAAIKEAMTGGIQTHITDKSQSLPDTRPITPLGLPSSQFHPGYNHASKHPSKQSITVYPLPVDLKAGQNKIGLRQFYAEKNPANHYEKSTLFVYYLTKYNLKTEVKYGEILSCYEEVDEKKPSIIDIVKNSIRYKGWLEQGSDRFSTRLTISGDNFIKFDLPKQKDPRTIHTQMETSGGIIS